jgi:restriction system protein
MAEITIRRTGESLRKLFQILLEQPDGLPGREALAKLRTQTQMTEHEKGRYEGGGLRFDQIIRFATVDVSKAG